MYLSHTPCRIAVASVPALDLLERAGAEGVLVAVAVPVEAGMRCFGGIVCGGVGVCGLD